MSSGLFRVTLPPEMPKGVTIRPARRSDLHAIHQLRTQVGRPSRRVIRISEYLVATQGPVLVGCAAVHPTSAGGYLYGLAVRRASQRQGIGAALTLARLERIRRRGGGIAVVLAMFWNVKFFSRLGFQLTKRDDLPAPARRISDMRDPLYRRSAVMVFPLGNETLSTPIAP